MQDDREPVGRSLDFRLRRLLGENLHDDGRRSQRLLFGQRLGDLDLVQTPEEAGRDLIDTVRERVDGDVDREVFPAICGDSAERTFQRFHS